MKTKKIVAKTGSGKKVVKKSASIPKGAADASEQKKEISISQQTTAQSQNNVQLLKPYKDSHSNNSSVVKSKIAIKPVTKVAKQVVGVADAQVKQQADEVVIKKQQSSDKTENNRGVSPGYSALQCDNNDRSLQVNRVDPHKDETRQRSLSRPTVGNTNMAGVKRTHKRQAEMAVAGGERQSAVASRVASHSPSLHPAAAQNNNNLNAASDNRLNMSMLE